MNPEILKDPKKFLWPFVQARQAQKQMEDKLVEVEKDFALKQAFIGWMMDNPWIYALLLNREVQRIEGNSCAEAKKKVVELEKDLAECKAAAHTYDQLQSQQEIAELKSSIATIYRAVISQIVIIVEEFKASLDADLSSADDSMDNTLFKENLQAQAEEQLAKIPAEILTYYNELFVLTGAANYVTLAERAQDLPSIEEAKANPYTLSHFMEVDNLEKIIGIGPKVADVLNAAGIKTFADLAESSVDKIMEILSAADSPISNTNMMSPAEWIEQAKLLADSDCGEEQWEDWKTKKMNNKSE